MITHIVVGAGRMGSAMIAGWTSGKAPAVKLENILIVDPKPSMAAQSFIDQGAQHVARLEQVVPTAQYVLLAIKPQSFSAIGPEVGLCLPKGAVVISILAGTTQAQLKDAFPKQSAVRTMPNTPAAIGQGITGCLFPDGLDDEQKSHVELLLGAAGQVVHLENEGQIDAVTAISGSGPAYFFYMVEALSAAGRSIGLSDDQAEKLARATLSGAGALLSQNEQGAGELRQAVTSPGGTTQAALDVLMKEDGLAPVIREAVNAAYRRSQELGKISD